MGCFLWHHTLNNYQVVWDAPVFPSCVIEHENATWSVLSPASWLWAQSTGVVLQSPICFTDLKERSHLKPRCTSLHEAYLLLGSVLLCYQGDVLRTDHVWALHGDLLRAGVICLDHRRRVADVGVVNGVWIEIESISDNAIPCKILTCHAFVHI